MQASFVELQNNKDVMNSAKRVFAENCAACHGERGQGQALAFPNLMDDEWQWGGDISDIENSIRHGRRATNDWLERNGQRGGRVSTCKYVKSLSQDGSMESNHAGEEKFKQICVACHGEEGRGKCCFRGTKSNK